MSKSFLTGILSHLVASNSAVWMSVVAGAWLGFSLPQTACVAQEPAAAAEQNETPAEAAPEPESASEPAEPSATEAEPSATEDNGAAKTTDAPSTDADAGPAFVQYPIATAADGDVVYMVDLNLPGVWKLTAEGRELYYRGTKWLRKPMNRPRPVAIHPDGGLLVGDSATREVYHIRSGEPAVPLCESYIGVAMSIAVAPDGKNFYVGDAEKRATFRVPIGGGKPELIDRVDARGLAFDEQGNLWAVTPNADAVMKIDVKAKKSEAIVTERPFNFPNGLVWAGDHGFVVDVYDKAIWKFTADGKTEKWVEGDFFVSPNGIGISDSSVFVTDPRAKQLFEFDRKSGKRTDRLSSDAFDPPK